MAGFDYDRMQRTATRLIDRFRQGEVLLTRSAPSVPDHGAPWTPGPPTETVYELAATVVRVHQRYENGALIVQTGDMVTFAVPPVTPMITDKLTIDGVARSITNLTPVPAAGTPVAWKAWCAG